MTQATIPTERITLSEDGAAKAIARHGFIVAICDGDGKPVKFTPCVDQADADDARDELAKANPDAMIATYKVQKVSNACRAQSSI